MEGQVLTRIISPSDFKKIIPFSTDEKKRALELTKPDVEKILKNDAQFKKNIPRSGILVPTSFSLNDGIWLKNAKSYVWKFSLHAERAKFLSFYFSGIQFPEGTELFIHSKDKRMVVGPVVKSNLYDGSYVSDMINGDEATVLVVIPKTSKKGDFKIELINISYGIQKNGSRFFGDSQPCNNNINCSVGSAWGDVRNGVAQIYTGESSCTGSLVQDECESGRSFFLTAFHCLDKNGDGVFSKSELATLPNWVLRFFYESPTCPNIEPTEWVTYFGTQFRAGW